MPAPARTASLTLAVALLPHHPHPHPMNIPTSTLLPPNLPPLQDNSLLAAKAQQVLNCPSHKEMQTSSLAHTHF